MKNLIQLATVLLLLANTIGYGQAKSTNTDSKKQESEIKIDAKKLKKFVGTYFLAEGDFNLEIVMEKDKMYIVSPFSKDLLVHKDENTLRESTRGVDLALIKDDKDALKFTQNGYETVIKRVKPKTKGN